MSDYVVFSDVHCPYQDDRAMSSVKNFVTRVKPNTVVLNGDIFDFPSISKYQKPYSLMADFGNQVKKCRDMLSDIATWSSKSKIVFLQGNHEDRWKTWLQSHTELEGFEDLSFENVFRFKELGIDVKPYNTFIEMGDVCISHGYKVMSKSGCTGHRYMDELAVSGITGHTHRLAIVHKRYKDRDVFWVEGGCLCNLEQAYLKGSLADWSHGYVYGTEYGAVYPIKITNGKSQFGDEVFK